MKPPFGRRPKYRNKKVEVDGVKYDSKKEYARWLFLREMEDRGEIADLRHHVKFRIEVRGHLICRYEADFVYRTSEGRVIEDVKSPITRIEPSYRLKAKLMAAIHGKITEV